MPAYKSYLYKPGNRVPTSTFYYRRKLTEKAISTQLKAVARVREAQSADTSTTLQVTESLDPGPTQHDDNCGSYEFSQAFCAGTAQGNSLQKNSMQAITVHAQGIQNEVDNCGSDSLERCSSAGTVPSQLTPDYTTSTLQTPFSVLASSSEENAAFYDDNQENMKSDDTSDDKSDRVLLCSHSECTADDVMLMCLTLGMRHNLTWTAQVDILKMVNAIYGENKIKASKYNYLKVLQNEDLAVSYHAYCSSCSFYLGKLDSLNSSTFCRHCETTQEVRKCNNFFMSLSLKDQLTKLFQDTKIADMVLTYRFNRKKENIDALEDIYDGFEYKKLAANGQILSSPYNFSYSFFTDGVPLGKSAQKTLWPIYVTINELPPKERSKHVLLCGLYVGPKDPTQNIFMHPFVQEANQLSSQGFEWNHNGQVVTSKVVPVIAIADSVARCQLLNMQTFSALYGCTFCYQAQTPTIKKLKYTLPTETVEFRTVASVEINIKKAYERRFENEERKRQSKGVKGPSVLRNLDYVDYINAFVVDYMHAILLGVTKKHFELLLDCSKKNYWRKSNYDGMGCFSKEDILNCIDERLLLIQPPSSITRTPRSVKEWKLWKASEWRSWLLFYMLPCLSGLLRNKYVAHLAMLCEATNFLLQKSVTLDEVKEANILFTRYMIHFQNYFGKEHMYYNVHLLAHVCRGVLRWGPLWCHNAFLYEGTNRQLLQMAKNPRQVLLEISRKYLVFKSIPRLIFKYASNDHTLFFCEDILENRLTRYIRGGNAGEGQ